MGSGPVTVTIGGLPFECVHLQSADFNDAAAVYVILCVSEGGSWQVLDVGQTGQLGSRLDSHDRKACWLANCPNKNVWVCVYKMPTERFSEDDRLRLEKTLRQQYNPPCGQR
jgi:hypothetical protein